jgi:hypothetical protein
VRERDIYDEAGDLLGTSGRMLSGSKTAPPEKRVVWNGNVLVGKLKVWYGDISIRDSAEQLQALANLSGEAVSVLREHDARFGTEKDPDFRNSVEQFFPEAS